MRKSLFAVTMALPLLLAPAALAQTEMPKAPPQTPGASTPQLPLTEAEILRALQAKGYSDLRTVQSDGDRYQIQGKKNGQPVMLVVDARTGAYTETAG